MHCTIRPHECTPQDAGHDSKIRCIYLGGSHECGWINRGRADAGDRRQSAKAARCARVLRRFRALAFGAYPDQGICYDDRSRDPGLRHRLPRPLPRPRASPRPASRTMGTLVHTSVFFRERLGSCTRKTLLLGQCIRIRGKTRVQFVVALWEPIR